MKRARSCIYLEMKTTLSTDGLCSKTFTNDASNMAIGAKVSRFFNAVEVVNVNVDGYHATSFLLVARERAPLPAFASESRYGDRSNDRPFHYPCFCQVQQDLR